jgi:hypothetical protein
MTSRLQRLILQRRRSRFATSMCAVPRPLGRPLRVLDLGGTWAYWQAMPWQQLEPIAVTLLNLTSQEVSPPFTTAVGDARDLSRYPDRSFDLVYSNSVIYLVGTFADQAQMAREIQRVGCAHIVQTANHHFPLDWRTLVPGFHFLPPTIQAACFRLMRVGTYPRANDWHTAWTWATRVRDLTCRELRALFPHSQIRRERILGWTKSFIVMS